MKMTLLALMLIGTVSGAAFAAPALGTSDSSYKNVGVQPIHYTDTGNACRKFLNDPACVAGWAHKSEHGYNPSAIQDKETNDDVYQYNSGGHSGSFKRM